METCEKELFIEEVGAWKKCSRHVSEKERRDEGVDSQRVSEIMDEANIGRER